MLKIVNEEKVAPKELIENIYKKFGRFYTKRIDLRFSEDERALVKNFIDSFSSSEIFNLKIKNIDRKDGLLIYFHEDYSYILFRISGTENVVRVYFETTDKNLFEYLNKNVLDFINNLKGE